MKQKHVVMFSTGAGSAYLAKYVLDKYGKDDTILLITDTKWEDEDNYRFMDDVSKYLGVPITFQDDGRTPEDIFKEQLWFGNFGTAPCSKELKMKQTFLFVQDIIEKGYLPILYFGIGYGEIQRAPRIAFNYKHNVDVFEDGVEVRFPLVGEINGVPVNGDDLFYGTNDFEKEKMPKTRSKEVYERLEKQDFKPCAIQPKRIISEEWGIKLPRMYELGFSHANCFSGDTKFLTDKGTKTFAEMVGQKTNVLGIRANWHEAEIKSFGEQPIVELTIQRNGVTKKIKTTAEHRWFKRKGRKSEEEVFTKDLKAGDYLKSMHSKKNPLIRPSSFGVAHGITFGDGSVTSKWNPPARLMLCGEKAHDLIDFFDNSPKTVVEGIGIEIKDLPRHFKELPSIEECKSYLYGWLVGYFAADGNATNGEFTLSSAKKENLEFVRDVANVIGISTHPIRTYLRKGFNKEKTELHNVAFVASTLNEDFLVRRKHSDEFLEWKKRRSHKPSDWKVVNVEETSETQEVYCAVVPNGQAFTLEDNLYTGNCAGRCIKGGFNHYRTLFKVWPDKYLEQEKMEKEINDERTRQGKTIYTILGKEQRLTNGEKKKQPYSLERYRKEVLEMENQTDIFDFLDEDEKPCECVF